MGEKFQTKLIGSDNHSYRELFRKSPKSPVLSSKYWLYSAATMYDNKVLLLAMLCLVLESL